VGRAGKGGTDGGGSEGGAITLAPAPNKFLPTSMLLDEAPVAY
jgi:hypothetical protein